MTKHLIRTADPDRGGKLCRCARCGRVEVCTLFSDFYQQDDDKNGPIICETCIITRNAWDQIPADWLTSRRGAA